MISLGDMSGHASTGTVVATFGRGHGSTGNSYQVT